MFRPCGQGDEGEASAIAAYTVLALLDVSLVYIWPLLAVAAFTSFKLFTIGP